MSTAVPPSGAGESADAVEVAVGGAEWEGIPGIPDMPGVMPDWKLIEGPLLVGGADVGLEQAAVSRTPTAASGSITFTTYR
jgi:hypothetical protein